MDFSVIAKEEQVTIRTADGEKRYVLREASGEAAVKYRNAVMNRTKLGPDGKLIGFSTIADVEPYLVALCLWDGDRTVHEHVIKSWPARVQKALFAKVKEMSDLDELPDDAAVLRKRIAEDQARLAKLEGSEDEAKNLPNASTAGSS